MSNALLICWHCLNKHFAVSTFPTLYFTSLMVGFPAKERRRKEKKDIQKGQTCSASPAHPLGYSGLCFPLGEGQVGSEEVQNRSLQNTPLWHIDYFEPKALEKQQVRKGSLPSAFLPKAGHNISPEKGVLPSLPQEEKNILITGGWESRLRWICTNNSDLPLVSPIYFLVAFP